MDGYGVNLQLRLVGLSTASGAAVLGEARTLARVAEMLWRVRSQGAGRNAFWPTFKGWIHNPLIFLAIFLEIFALTLKFALNYQYIAGSP